MFESSSVLVQVVDATERRIVSADNLEDEIIRVFVEDMALGEDEHVVFELTFATWRRFASHIDLFMENRRREGVSCSGSCSR